MVIQDPSFPTVRPSGFKTLRSLYAVHMKIKIWETEQDGGGCMFNIWLNEDADDDSECDDGGLCTGSDLDAIDMACGQAKNLLEIKNKES